MRALSGMVLVVLAVMGCGVEPAKTELKSGKPGSVSGKQEPIQPTALRGSYIGTLAGPEETESSPLPPSIRQVVGDSNLELMEGDKFAMTHKGLNFVGTYRIDGTQVVLQVEQVEGMSQDQLADVDLVANKRAGKEPSSPEMLEIYREIVFLTDWRFEVKSGVLKQVGSGSDSSGYEFKRKPE